MTRIKFDIKAEDSKLLQLYELNLKYINGYDFHNRTTVIDYENVESGCNVPVIRYNIFKDYPDIVSGFSTRIGGVSKEHLASMNLSFSRGDIRENVMTNHKRFSLAVGYDYTKLVFSDQVHDVKIHKVTKDDIGKGIIRESDIVGIDGLVTDVPGIPLITFYADCVPLYFYDPVMKVVALVHSGWKGTVGHIGSVMVEYMGKEYGSKPGDIVCAIGPSICMDCYEVSEDVAEAFKEAYSKEQFDSMIYNKGNGKYQLNLHEACYYNFVNAGVKEENIALPDLCTCCNSNILFSHRASKGMRGNLGAVIMIKE